MIRHEVLVNGSMTSAAQRVPRRLFDLREQFSPENRLAKSENVTSMFIESAESAMRISGLSVRG